MDLSGVLAARSPLAQNRPAADILAKGNAGEVARFGNLSSRSPPMAREERDREDLLREATALIQRVELEVPGYDEPVVVGFRRGGAGSIYFGAEPVYQFTTEHQLRRAYAGGLLYKAERGRLIALERRRAPGQVELVRHKLNAAATEQFLDAMARHLKAIRTAIEQSRVRIIGQEPPDWHPLDAVAAWLGQVTQCRAVARSPRVA